LFKYYKHFKSGFFLDFPLN